MQVIGRHSRESGNQRSSFTRKLETIGYLEVFGCRRIHRSITSIPAFAGMTNTSARFRGDDDSVVVCSTNLTC